MGCGAGQLRADLQQKDTELRRLQEELRCESASAAASHAAENAAASSQQLIEDLKSQLEHSNQDLHVRVSEMHDELLESHAVQLKSEIRSLEHAAALRPAGTQTSFLSAASPSLKADTTAQSAGLAGRSAASCSMVIGSPPAVPPADYSFSAIHEQTDLMEQVQQEHMREAQNLHVQLEQLRTELAERATMLQKSEAESRVLSNEHTELMNKKLSTNASEAAAEQRCSEMRRSMENLTAERNEAVSEQADFAAVCKRVLHSRDEALDKAAAEFETAMMECGAALLERDEALQERNSDVAMARSEVDSMQRLLKDASEQVESDRAQIAKLQDLVSLCARSGATRAAAEYWQYAMPIGATPILTNTPNDFSSLSGARAIHAAVFPSRTMHHSPSRSRSFVR